MARVVDQVKLEVWRKRLVEFQASGLSVAAFCRRENIGATRFYYWSGKVREAGAEDCQASASGNGRAASRSGAASGSGACLLGDESLGAEQVGSGARVEIFVGDSIRLSMPLGEPEVIAAVVQRLRAPGQASRTAESSSGASASRGSSAGAFRRIEVVSGR